MVRAEWRRRLFGASLAAFTIGLAQAAQAAGEPAGPQPTDADVAEATAPANGVISYPPAFFDQFQPANAHDMVTRIPGFSFSGGDNVRGFQGAVGNVLIDGQRPSAKSLSLQDLLQRIPAGQVERIDLIRGGAPGIDMQGLPVLANVIRKRSAALTGAVEFGTKLYSRWAPGQLGKLQLTKEFGALTLDGTVNVEVGKGDFDISRGHQTRTDAAGRYLSFGDLVIDVDSRLYQANGSAEYRRPKDLFHLNVGLERQDTPRLETARLKNAALVPFTEVLDQTTRDDKAEVGADYERQLGAGVTAQLVGLHTYKMNDLVSGFVTPTTNTVSTRHGITGESILRASVQGLTWRGVGFAAGLEGAYNTLDSTSGLIRNGVVQMLPSANVTVKEKRAEGFVTVSNRPTPATSLEVGLRVETSTISQSGDANRSRSFTFPKPRLIATWAPDGSSQLRLRIERVVGQLNFQDFAASGDLTLGAAAGNANLQPERAWVFEGAVEKRFWGQGAVVFTYTHREIQQVADRVAIYTPNGVFDAPGNIPEGTRDEFKLSVTLPLDKLGVPHTQIRSTGTWRRSSTIDPITGERRIIQVPPTIQGNMAFFGDFYIIHDVPQWGSTFQLFLLPYGFEQVQYRLAEYRKDRRPVVFRASWNWKISNTWLLRAQVDNWIPKHITRDRYLYTPTRAGAFVQREYRRTHGGPQYTIRFRKTF